MHSTQDQPFDVCINSWLKHWHLPRSEDGRESLDMSMSLLQPFKNVGSMLIWSLVVHLHQVPLILHWWLLLIMLSLHMFQCCSIDSLSQLSIRVGDSEFVVTTSANNYVYFEVEFDLIHPHIPTEKYFEYIECIKCL